MHIKLEFKVERRLGDPNLRILVDENLCSFDGPCPDNLEFDVQIVPGEHEIRLQHYGKTYRDHQYNENNEVIVDKHFELLQMYFDDVPLKDILWEGEFFPVYDTKYKEQNEDLPYSIKPNLYFGHNGSWQLSFAYPAVDWLIEKQDLVKVKDPDWLTNHEELIQVKEFFKTAKGLDWDNIV